MPDGRKDAGMIPVCVNHWLRPVLLISLLLMGAGGASRGEPLPEGRVPVLPPVEAEPISTSSAHQLPPIPRTEQGPPLSGKQKRNLMKANFEKMKRDSDELVDLAKSLQEDLGKSNENVLSLQIIEKAEKIEKLAKRIKGTARGF
jgi:hypothetical protein